MTSKLDPQELERLLTRYEELVGRHYRGTLELRGQAEKYEADLRLASDLRDKLRTGQLVPAMPSETCPSPEGCGYCKEHGCPRAQPSGDVVEAVAVSLAEFECANWDAQSFNETPAGETPDEMRRGYLAKATAAITTYEAVSGLAKMREALEDLRATPYPPVEDPDDTLGTMLDNQAWIVLSHVASRIGQRDGIEFMERWQDAWAEGEVQKGYFSPHRGVAAWIARHCQLTPEARAALGEKA